MFKNVKRFSVNLDDQKAKTKAAEHLFNVRENANKLNKKKAQEFHTMVMKSSLLCKFSRPDIHTAVAYLTT